MSEDKTLEMEVVQPSQMEAITSGRYTSLIRLAKQFPRSMREFTRRGIEEATMDGETAEKCIWRRIVGKDKQTGKPVTKEGLSIRMAEIAAKCYGNIFSECYIIGEKPEKSTAVGVCVDLESITGCKIEVPQSTLYDNGEPFSLRMRELAQAGLVKKAIRNAS